MGGCRPEEHHVGTRVTERMPPLESKTQCRLMIEKKQKNNLPFIHTNVKDTESITYTKK